MSDDDYTPLCTRCGRRSIRVLEDEDGRTVTEQCDACGHTETKTVHDDPIPAFYAHG
jgi:ribosomal protein L37E